LNVKRQSHLWPPRSPLAAVRELRKEAAVEGGGLGGADCDEDEDDCDKGEVEEALPAREQRRADADQEEAVRVRDGPARVVRRLRCARSGRETGRAGS
jgi:hypothetical protein